MESKRRQDDPKWCQNDWKWSQNACILNHVMKIQWKRSDAMLYMAKKATFGRFKPPPPPHAAFEAGHFGMFLKFRSLTPLQWSRNIGKKNSPFSFCKIHVFFLPPFQQPGIPHFGIFQVHGLYIVHKGEIQKYSKKNCFSSFWGIWFPWFFHVNSLGASPAPRRPNSPV